MNRTTIIVAAAALGLAIPATSAAQQPGDWVLAQWQGGAIWYPGVVTARSGNIVTIRYDDGTMERRPVNQVRAYDWRVGTRIVCQWEDGNWYRATITRMSSDGVTLDILYDDGYTQRTTTGSCRQGG